MSLNRTLAGLINTSGDVKSTSLDNVPPSGLDSAQVLSIAGGLTVYATLDDLPTSGLTSGDQAFITATNRIYVSNGSGWYNVALINATPRLTIDPIGAVTLATDGTTPTFITLTATDSDNPIAALTYSVESDGNFAGLGTITQNIYDPEYNNGAIIDVTGNGSDFFKREVTTNGVRIMGAGTVGGQTAVPDAWLEKVGRTFELFTDPNGAGINETSQRALIQNLSGDSGTYHAGFPTIQRVARGAGADYTPNFLSDSGISYWNLTDLFDNTVQNDMVWYLNSTGSGYGDGDNDAQEVIEHAFHTLHMHGLDAQSLKMYPSISSDWNTGPLYNAMVEAYDAGKWDPSGYNSPANAFKTDGDAFQVAAKEYLFLLNFCMFEYSSLWEGGSLAPEWTDDMRTPAGIQANNPLGYALHNTYIAPVISKPSLATIRSIFQDGNTPAQDDPSLAGASGYVVSPSNASFTITPLSGDSATTSSATLTFKASDGISFGSGTRTFTLSFKVENSNYTTLLAKADTAGTDNQVDASTNNHTITENGNVTSTAFTPYHPGGYSTYFDGTEDYLTVTNDISLNVGTGDFTLEAWFYLNADDGSYNICSQYASGNTGGIWLGRYSNGFVFRRGGIADVITASSLPSVGEWHHVAVSRASGSTKLFIDGTQTGSTVSSDTNNYGVTAPFYIGSDNAAPASGYMNGYIRDFRLVKGTGVYASNFTPPTEPLTAITNTSLLACHAPYIADGSTNGNTITVNGNTSTKRFGPYDYLGYAKANHGGSVYFDGSGDYLSNNDVEFYLDENDNGSSSTPSNFSFNFWTYLTDLSAQYRTFFSRYGASWSYNLYWDEINKKFTFNINSSGSTTNLDLNFYHSNGLKINQWFYISFRREGTGTNSSTYKLYLNGTQIGGDQTDNGKINRNGSSSPFRIGIAAGGSESLLFPLTGYIADFELKKGAQGVYSPFAESTSVSIAPITSGANTELLTCTNKNDIWEQGSGFLLTKAGNTTASDTQRQFTSSSAIYFDGTGDYLSGNDMGLGGAGAFTVEAWVYPTVYNTYANDIYSHGANLSVGADFLAFGLKSDGNVQMFKGSGSPALLSTSAPCSTLNQWYHVAFVRESNNNTSAYVNGVLVAGPTSISGNLTSAPSGRAFIGTQSYSAGDVNRSFEGYMQDVRVTKGLARYTSNFTPPTAEFDG